MGPVTPLTPVLLPGLDGTGDLFERFLAAAPANCSPVCLALPNDRSRSYRELAAWVAQRLPAGPLALIAESFSGPLAVLIAAGNPQVRALVLCATFVEPPLPRFLARVPARLFDRVPPSALLRAVLTGGDRALAEAIRGALANLSGALVASRVRQALTVEIDAELAQLSCPVLVLSAKRDHIMRRSIAAKLPQSTLVELDAPHLLLQTRAREAWAEITRFLARQ